MRGFRDVRGFRGVGGRSDAVLIVRGVVTVVLVILVLVFVLEVFDGDAVQFVQARQGVGLLVLVGYDGTGKGLPGGLWAARGEQSVAIGVEQPGRPGPQPPVGQLRDL